MSTAVPVDARAGAGSSRAGAGPSGAAVSSAVTGSVAGPRSQTRQSPPRRPPGSIGASGSSRARVSRSLASTSPTGSPVGTSSSEAVGAGADGASSAACQREASNAVRGDEAAGPAGSACGHCVSRVSCALRTSQSDCVCVDATFAIVGADAGADVGWASGAGRRPLPRSTARSTARSTTVSASRSTSQSRSGPATVCRRDGSSGRPTLASTGNDSRSSVGCGARTSFGTSAGQPPSRTKARVSNPVRARSSTGRSASRAGGIIPRRTRPSQRLPSSTAISMPSGVRSAQVQDRVRGTPSITTVTSVSPGMTSGSVGSRPASRARARAVASASRSGSRMTVS